MVDTYCIVHKKPTGNRNVRYETDKSGRRMMISSCEIDGHKKVRFVSKSGGGGVIGEATQAINPMISIYKTLPGVDKKLFDKYWSGDIARGAFNKKTGLFSKKFWTHPKNRTDAKCNYVSYDKRTGKYVNHYCD